mgnify:FL=1
MKVLATVDLPAPMPPVSPTLITDPSVSDTDRRRWSRRGRERAAAGAVESRWASIAVSALRRGDDALMEGMRTTNYFPVVVWVLILLMIVAAAVVLWPGTS